MGFEQDNRLEIDVISTFKEWDFGSIYCDDALTFLNTIPKNSADLIFLDPPFNLGKKYGSRSKKDDYIDESEYEEYISKVIDESIRILAEGGALYFYHIPEWASIFSNILNKRLTFRHWISVSMKNGFVRGNYLYPAHYALLYYTKGEPMFFKRPKVPAERCRHCDNYIKDYGGYKKYIKDGINLSDIWTDFSPVRHKNKKNRPANELPLDLLDRILAISGFENGVLVDPFVGSGTSAISAIKKKMFLQINDREEKSCEITIERVNQFLNNHDS